MLVKYISFATRKHFAFFMEKVLKHVNETRDWYESDFRIVNTQRTKLLYVSGNGDFTGWNIINNRHFGSEMYVHSLKIDFLKKKIVSEKNPFCKKKRNNSLQRSVFKIVLFS